MELCALELLRDARNLLAFSAGSDSSALFFALAQRQIPFDIAIVDYGLRPQSKEEVAYAKELAVRYEKEIYIHQAHVTPPNFEAKAREERYRFFEKIIKNEGYDNLILAHQLNDQFEWLLMRMSKGAGVVEMVGMDVVSRRGEYNLVRPMLYVPKNEILAYLASHNIRYFEDSTNRDLQIERNYIRHTFSDPFVARFAPGVARTLRYLHEDKRLLLERIEEYEQLFIARNPHDLYATQRILDRMAKRLGYLLSRAQKEEMVRQGRGVVGGKIAFAIEEDKIWMAPYVKKVVPKKMRERMRRAGIPAPVRGYVATKPALLDRLSARNRS